MDKTLITCRTHRAGNGRYIVRAYSQTGNYCPIERDEKVILLKVTRATQTGWITLPQWLPNDINNACLFKRQGDALKLAWRQIAFHIRVNEILPQFAGTWAEVPLPKPISWRAELPCNV